MGVGSTTVVQLGNAKTAAAAVMIANNGFFIGFFGLVGREVDRTELRLTSRERPARDGRASFRFRYRWDSSDMSRRIRVH